MSEENKGLIKLGTFNEFTPNGNSFDATYNSLTYNDEKELLENKDKKEEKE